MMILGWPLTFLRPNFCPSCCGNTGRKLHGFSSYAMAVLLRWANHGPWASCFIFCMSSGYVSASLFRVTCYIFAGELWGGGSGGGGKGYNLLYPTQTRELDIWCHWSIGFFGILKYTEYSADNKLMLFFLIIASKQVWNFMLKFHADCQGDCLHETQSLFSGKK